MASKTILVLLLIAIVIQLTSCNTLRKVRDVPTTSDAGKAIDDAVDSVKSSLDDLLKNIQDSDILKELGDAAKKFGDSVQSQGKQLIEKIQSTATAAAPTN